MNEQLFEQVADILQEQMPAKWEKVVFFAAYLTDSYEMKFFVKASGKPYIDCFSLPGGNDMKILRMFVRIDKILSLERKRLPEDKRWNIMTLSVTRDGGFKADFDYKNVDETFIDYVHEWEDKCIANDG